MRLRKGGGARKAFRPNLGHHLHRRQNPKASPEHPKSLKRFYSLCPLSGTPRACTVCLLLRLSRSQVSGTQRRCMRDGCSTEGLSCTCSEIRTVLSCVLLPSHRTLVAFPCLCLPSADVSSESHIRPWQGSAAFQPGIVLLLSLQGPSLHCPG